MNIFPKKLNKGSDIRVVAPSRSIAIISEDNRKIANERLAELGFNVSFGKHVEECDDFLSSSIASRVSDLHDAFSDDSIDAVFSVIGGFNCNQLLRYIDWDLIKNHPKIFIGYSDTTALQNAILAKTGLVTYSGPAWSTFGQKLYFDYSMDYFKKCLMNDNPFFIEPSESWSDDEWYKNQEDRHFIKNNGWHMINEGEAKGTIVGANLCTFNLLQGTEYFPRLNDSVLFIEDDGPSDAVTFDRDLQSLIHQKEFNGVRGLVIGRFQKQSNMEDRLLDQIIKSKKELAKIPVITGVDFGHTSPLITYPIGGEASMTADAGNIEIKILKH
jgi:muramoyltetrapeptide carboxypeptidase LdcA involved in peptidoglycan recycling